MSQTPQPGTIGWMDLTVEDAARVRQFYEAVAGWTAQEHPLEGYSDYVMMTPGGAPAGGVCHARGANAALPPVWLIYIVVEDLDGQIAEGHVPLCRGDVGRDDLTAAFVDRIDDRTELAGGLLDGDPVGDALGKRRHGAPRRRW